MSVHAPYNFVTLSRFIYEVDRADRISHDVPFSDGVSGEFDIEITAHSKILIGGERGAQNGIQTVAPFKLPDGKYAIPESSLRGMIRNVLEIAAFGRMQFVDDRRFGIRDLTEAGVPYYRDRIVNRVKAGWLWFDGAEMKTRGSGWKITPCSMARVRFEELEKIARTSGIKNPITWDRKGDAPERYERWGIENITQTLMIDDGERERMASLPKQADQAGKNGQLVFTGNTGARRNAKKAEFFFFDSQDDATALAVPAEVFNSFKAIHDPEDGRTKNPAWHYWQGRWKKNIATRIPVFYIVENEKVASFGLAFMFKLAHSLSVKQVIANTGDNHDRPEIIDLPTALFGYASDKGGDAPQGLKSRVYLGLAKCTPDSNGVQPRPINEDETVLSGPKPSYFPCYIRQPTTSGDSGRLPRTQTVGRRVYATYTPLLSEREPQLHSPELRGWKRYPAGRQDEVTPPNPDIGNKVKILLRPLPEGTCFTSRVRFHNLRPVELGALLWALEWGGTAGLRHRLGMGKPYGYGQVGIRVNDQAWRLARNAGGACLTKQGYVAAFTAEMERAYCGAGGRSWAQSEQLRQLCAMADPTAAARHDLSYMILRAGRNVEPLNEFQATKNSCEVLPDYLPTDDTGPREYQIWPRTLPSLQAEKHAAQSPPPFVPGETAIWLDEHLEVEIISVEAGFAVVAVGDGDQERVPLRSLKKLSAPSSAAARRR